MKNILEYFLDTIEVNYTKMYADKLYCEHPHRYNMYGLKKMLDVYGVKMLGTYIKNANPSLLTYPCIIHTHDDFVIGLEYNGDTITYMQHGKSITIPHDAFKRLWTGNALVVEETTIASEPDYKKHQREELLSQAKAYSIPAMLVLFIIIGIANHLDAINIYNIIYLLLGLIGVLVSCMLMQKQIFGESLYGDKVCNLLRHADCNNVLNGLNARIFGVSWSEVGLGYFMASILLLSLYPTSAGMVTVINWLAMLYGVWSIYYQWRIAESWCILCVAVQVIIWAMGITAFVYYMATPFNSTISDSLLVGTVFALCIMIVHHYASVYVTGKERSLVVQQFRALKANNAVAKALIEKSKYYEITLDDSSIIFGNPNSDIRVTMLSNPHCNPCARIHIEVEKLLNAKGNDLCVQYIFSSFSEHWEDSSRYLIAAYFNNVQQQTRKIYSSWYAGDKNKYKELILRNADVIGSTKVEMELQKHRNWIKKSGLVTTPTILVNGYELPREFTLNDLSMLTKCNIGKGARNIMHDINGRSTTPLGAESQSAEEAV